MLEGLHCLESSGHLATKKYYMQTKSKDKINIVTLGCAKNIVDSEVLLTQLKGNKHKFEGAYSCPFFYK